MQKPSSNLIHYQIEPFDLNAHLFKVRLRITKPQVLQRVSLPVWIPGSYLIREFSKHLQHIRAEQNNQNIELNQIDKNTWEVKSACNPHECLDFCYEVYAFDSSVRTAFLDQQRGFFNATSLCLRVHDQTHFPHQLHICEPSLNNYQNHWRVASALKSIEINQNGFGLYEAENYDELADSPFELGDFWEGSFSVAGVLHRFIVAGAPITFDGEKLLNDTQKICETAFEFWHGKEATKLNESGVFPHTAKHSRYVFMLNAVQNAYGGLEHRNSTALICNRSDLPRLNETKNSEGYITLLGLISHEYFHTWNVKQLRPASFYSYDYNAENYTDLLWFFEGFTSYFDDLLLYRAKLIDAPTYLKLLNKTINQVDQTPGKYIQSVSKSSWDAWIKYYRIDENTPNITVNYYTKGALIALCFDLLLQKENAKIHVDLNNKINNCNYLNHANLNNVMRLLWHRCVELVDQNQFNLNKSNQLNHQNNERSGAMTQNDFLQAMQTIGLRDFSPELQMWVHETHDLPVAQLLEFAGVNCHEEPAQMAQTLGIRVKNDSNHSGDLQIQTVLRGSIAEQAGFAAGDEWLGIEIEAESEQPTSFNQNKNKNETKAWRIKQLSDLTLFAVSQKKIMALIARDQRLLRLSLVLPDVKSVTTKRLSVLDAEKIHAWLSAKETFD